MGNVGHQHEHRHGKQRRSGRRFALILLALLQHEYAHASQHRKQKAGAGGVLQQPLQADIQQPNKKVKNVEHHKRSKTVKSAPSNRLQVVGYNGRVDGRGGGGRRAQRVRKRGLTFGAGCRIVCRVGDGRLRGIAGWVILKTAA